MHEVGTWHLQSRRQLSQPTNGLVLVYARAICSRSTKDLAIYQKILVFGRRGVGSIPLAEVQELQI